MKDQDPLTYFDGKRFFFPGHQHQKRWRDVIKWSFTRKRGNWDHIPKRAVFDQPPERVTKGLRVSFVGHATLLIQTMGLNILTDPVWAAQIGPYSRFGPKRKTPPGILFENLPPIDCVLLSHTHYDHLDWKTMRDLSKRFSPHVITGLQTEKVLNRMGVFDVTSLGWYETSLFKGLPVTFVPAYHWTNRTLFDVNQSLWGGFMLKLPKGYCYFAGDTAFEEGALFKELREKFSPLLLALIPIGAYKPRWFMASSHVDPFEAVSIHKMIGAEKSLAIHHGTFALADEGYEDQRVDFQKACEDASLSKDEFILPEAGDFLFIDPK